MKRLAVLFLLLPMGANAAFIYDWEGICVQGCTGTATGILTLTDDYTPGTILSGNADSAFFLSFEYFSDNLTLTITAATVDAIDFQFRFDPTNNVEAFVGEQIASDTPSGFPLWQRIGGDPNWNAIIDLPGGRIFDQGIESMWTLRTAVSVPEPSTISLLLLGLMPLGFALCRRHAEKVC